jgi:Protein of unknown function (DUF4254)
MSHGLCGVATLFPALTAEWHESLPDSVGQGGILRSAVCLHAVNFGLWHCEDHARQLDAPDAHVARYKRAIDRLNIRRNRIIEEIDRSLLDVLPAASDDAALASETPGMIVDRVSIVSLRQFHTARRRVAESPGDSAAGDTQLRVLAAQARDLSAALDALLDDLAHGRRRLRVYQQFKGLAAAPCAGLDEIEQRVMRVIAPGGGE